MANTRIWLSEVQIKNYSRGERKAFEGYFSAFKVGSNIFDANTPKEVLEYVVTREKEKGNYWCPKHNTWERQETPPCYPDFTPAEYDSKAPPPTGGDGKEMGIGMTEQEEAFEAQLQKQMQEEDKKEMERQTAQDMLDKQQDEEKMKEKPWLIKLLNKCPKCGTEHLKTEKRPAPKPSDESKFLEYSELGCGCDVLEALLK